jgi:Alpha-2-macroglobulin family
MLLLKFFKIKYSYQTKDANGFIGNANISRPVVNEITSYSIRGVSMSKYNGIGLSELSPKFTIFMQFFISLELPIFVVRNEIITQDINIFNYLGQDQNVQVSIAKRDGFEMLNMIENEWSGKLIDRFCVRILLAT